MNNIGRDIIEARLYKCQIGLDLICHLYKQNLITDAYIVGSLAEGTATEKSDIDIVIVNPSFGEYVNFLDLQKIKEREPEDIFEEVISSFNYDVRKTIEYLLSIGVILKKFLYDNEEIIFQTYKGEKIDLFGYEDNKSLLGRPSLRIMKGDCNSNENYLN